GSAAGATSGPVARPARPPPRPARRGASWPRTTRQTDARAVAGGRLVGGVALVGGPRAGARRPGVLRRRAGAPRRTAPRLRFGRPRRLRRPPDQQLRRLGRQRPDRPARPDPAPR